MSNFENINIPWPGWKVIGELGEGGYGKVYEIERTQHGVTDRDALKIIRIPKNRREYEELAYRMSNDDEDSINAAFAEQKDKVIEEIRTMHMLKSSENIVGIKDWTVKKLDDGYSWEIYIRMDVLTPMIKYIKGRAIEESEVIRFGEDLCKALAQCEKEKIVHRDIKPDNIMVSPSGKFMLTDFGIARSLENETTMTGVGSKPYMAPEVANYQKSDHTVDIYSLGLVMYELLNNNRHPFLNISGKYSALERESAIQRRIKGEELPAPANGSDELKRIILKAASPERTKRYGSAQAMLDELIEVETGQTETYAESEDIKRYRLAAEQGHALAQSSLGDCYEKLEEEKNAKNRTNEDLESGREIDYGYLYRNKRAAEQGFAKAQSNYEDCCTKYEIENLKKRLKNLTDSDNNSEGIEALKKRLKELTGKDI